MNEFMNEQKDKLLINLVEPGRIGRCPFNSFFSFQLALPNGRADEKNRIDGPCGTKRLIKLMELILMERGEQAAPTKTTSINPIQPINSNKNKLLFFFD